MSQNDDPKLAISFGIYTREGPDVGFERGDNISIYTYIHISLKCDLFWQSFLQHIVVSRAACLVGMADLFEYESRQGVGRPIPGQYPTTVLGDRPQHSRKPPFSDSHYALSHLSRSEQKSNPFCLRKLKPASCAFL